MQTSQNALIGTPIVLPVTKVKYVLYARKSTESEERQILSIDSQVKEMLQLAEKEGLEIIDIRRESHSAKDSGQRPVFREILEDIRRQRFNGILTWAPDRLSRNAGDLGSLVDLMDQKLLIEIRTYGQYFRNSPNEKFLLMILCSQAKLENDNKSVNVKRGLRTRCEMGLRPGQPPVGYLNERHMDRKCQAIVDPERGPIIKKVFEKVAYEKWSGRKVYNWLKFDLNFKSVTGKKGLTISNIFQLLHNPFYYGVFEYPVKSGNFYTGKHIPLISRDLFDLVQQQVKTDAIRSEGKEFAFTKLMKCGLCGSGITAQEKFKKLKNGTLNRHVYYGCAKTKNVNCISGYINEDNLIKQLELLLDKINLDESGIMKKIKIESERHKKFQRLISGATDNFEVNDIDIKNYAKYILRNGHINEKRELLECMKGQIQLKDRTVSLI